MQNRSTATGRTGPAGTTGITGRTGSEQLETYWIYYGRTFSYWSTGPNWITRNWTLQEGPKELVTEEQVIEELEELVLLITGS